MASPRNNRSFSQLFEGFGKNLEEWALAKPMAWYEATKYKLEHLPQTNFDLGVFFAGQGKISDAIFRFRIAIYLQPDFVRAHYNLGCCYLRLNKRPQARQSFINTLKLEPHHEEALFMLSALDPNAVKASELPTRMPAHTVKEFFSGLTEYDAIETSNQYMGGRVCLELLKPLVTDKKDLHIVDLGCGTGLAVRGLRPYAKEISGVDFSAPMLQAAQSVKVGERVLFDQVIEEDLYAIDTSAAKLGEADAVILCNVAQFLGDLQFLFQALDAKLKAGTEFLLTIEPMNTSAGYAVNVDTGRFGHHPDYIKALATRTGFAVKNDGRVHLYPNLSSYYFLLTKASA